MTPTTLAVFSSWDTEFAPFVLGAMGIVAAVVVVAMFLLTVSRVSREAERTRREVAAYVAEGSMTAEDAEKILKPTPWWSRNGGWCGGVKPAKAKQAEA